MTLPACPNCSAYHHAFDRWYIGRPQVVLGRTSRKHFFSACCAFSGALKIGPYDTETEATDAWVNHRSTAAANNRRMAAILPALDEHDAALARRAERLKSIASSKSIPSQKRVAMFNAQPELL